MCKAKTTMHTLLLLSNILLSGFVKESVWRYRKGVIISGKSKDRQCYGQKKKDRKCYGQKKKDRQCYGQKKDRQCYGQKKKDRQCHGQKKKDKNTNNGQQTTDDWATETLLKPKC